MTCEFELPVDYTELTWRERRSVREEYVLRQNNLCFYCKGSLTELPPDWVLDHEIDWDLFPPQFLKYPIHLQHDHDTGMTEGAVHAYCNAVMWQYIDW
jgi:hypothetical protein